MALWCQLDICDFIPISTRRQNRRLYEYMAQFELDRNQCTKIIPFGMSRVGSGKTNKTRNTYIFPLLFAHKIHLTPIRSRRARKTRRLRSRSRAAASISSSARPGAPRTLPAHDPRAGRCLCGEAGGEIRSSVTIGNQTALLGLPTPILLALQLVRRQIL